MGNTLGVAYTAMSDQLRLSGDGQLLPPNWDPYTTPRVTGVNCKFEAEGLDHPRTHRRLHVTFRTMLNTINGLTDFLFNGERFGSVIVQVMDDGVQPDGEIIGTVRLYPYEDPSQSMDSGY